ncbi:MAG: PIN domain-containing protein [Nanoarchaeota archaeon]|nr:PIN domain-containing protein [Nanoarchaeota archaeon]
MKLVVDTNVVISSLLKDSLTRRLITHIDADLYTLRFTQEEIDTHKQELLEKGGFSEVALNILLENILNKLVILGDEVVKSKMKEARELMDTIDWKDTPFIAAALATDADIWSDDKHFEKQRKIKVWKTRDLAKLFCPS